MTEKTIKPVVALAKEAIASDAEGLKALMRAAFQEVLEAEMTETLGAAKGERTGRRLGYRSGYYERDLITRMGKIELRVPQDRGGRFSTELFERYARAEKALLAALCEMYVQGVSTRKVKAITEELVGDCSRPRRSRRSSSVWTGSWSGSCAGSWPSRSRI